MIDFGLLIALGSLIVAAAVAGMNWRKSVRDRRAVVKADQERSAKAPAERDSIIVATAAEVVETLRLTLSDSRAENKQLRDQIEMQGKFIAEQEKRIRFLEYETARLTLLLRERELPSD